MANQIPDTDITTVWNTSTMSAALRDALDDLRKCEESEEYIVDMNEWHTPNSHCRVCLAGARMVGLGLPRHMCASPYAFEDIRTRHYLIAMDSLRLGEVSGAFAEAEWAFYENNREKISAMNRLVPSYATHREAWWEAMEKLHNDLVEAGF